MKNIEVNDKHIGLKIVLFIVFLVIAVSAFSYGVTLIGKKEAGYQTISASSSSSSGSDSSDVATFAKEISFSHYFEGSSNFIKKEVRTLQKVYSSVLLDVCRQLDAENSYEGAVSIGALNSNLGSVVSVSPELYAVLKDAYSRTLEKKNFNMFAGALYAEWKSILILDDASEFDPLNNEYMAYRISEIAREVSDLSNFTLEFLDDSTCSVRFSVSEHYLAFSSEFELGSVILDLNLMTNAYKLSLLAQKLEDLGYKNGYLVSNDGLVVTLSNTFEQSLVLYGIEDEDPLSSNIVQRGAVGVRGASSKVFMSAFSFGSYYNATVNGRLRHLFFDTTTGEIHDVILSCTIISEETSFEDLSVDFSGIVENMANLIYLCSLPSKSAVSDALSSLSSNCFVDCSFYCEF